MAVSEDEEPDSQAQERIHDQAGVSFTPNPTRTRATRRQSLRAQERRLLDQERRLLEQGSHAVDRVRVTTAGTFWSRLNAIDFMNSSLQFAALAVLCLFPFLITVSAESGGDARHALVARLGLDQEAARDVDKLMSSGSHTVTTLSIVGAALVLLGALGIASTLQVWYERAYDQPPAQNLARQLANRLLWLGGLMGYLTLQDFSFIQLKQVGGAPTTQRDVTGMLDVVAAPEVFRLGLRTVACRHHGLNAGRPARARCRWPSHHPA
jgi:hypothetical protein